jgi:hypothetical protein
MTGQTMISETSKVRLKTKGNVAFWLTIDLNYWRKWIVNWKQNITKWAILPAKWWITSLLTDSTRWTTLNKLIKRKANNNLTTIVLVLSINIRVRKYKKNPWKACFIKTQGMVTWLAHTKLVIHLS